MGYVLPRITNCQRVLLRRDDLISRSAHSPVGWVQGYSLCLDQHVVVPQLWYGYVLDLGLLALNDLDGFHG